MHEKFEEIAKPVTESQSLIADIFALRDEAYQQGYADGVASVKPRRKSTLAERKRVPYARSISYTAHTARHLSCRQELNLDVTVGAA